jgi:hypothetical protein
LRHGDLFLGRRHFHVRVGQHQFHRLAHGQRVRIVGLGIGFL